MKRLLGILALLTGMAYGQAINGPSNPTNTPNQTNVTTSWLYLNKMHFAGTWSSSTPYNSQDLVIYLGSSYVSLQAANTNNAPTGGAPWWTVLGGGGGGGTPGGTNGQVQWNNSGVFAGFTMSGDASVNTATGVLTFATVATPGTNLKLTYNAKGLVTAGTTAACSDLSNAAASCSTDATNAGNISAGTLPAGRMPAFTGDVTASGGSTVTALKNIPDLTPAAGSILHTAIAAPTTPAAGTSKVYVDSTSKNIAVKNDAGTVNHGVQTKALVSHQWLTAINDDGSSGQSQPACGDLSNAVASCSTDTTSASNISSGTLPSTARLPTADRARNFGAQFAGAVTTGLVAFGTIYEACTISAWHIDVDQGTVTVKVWKIATGGTARPTVANVISTSGISLSSGTLVDSTTVSDFTTTAVAAKDTWAITLTAVAGSPSSVNISIECDI